MERSSDGHYPNGHFYSPVIDVAQVEASARRIWPAQPEVLGIDFRHESHIALLREVFPRYICDYDYPATPPDPEHPHAFVDANPAFAWLDSRALFVLLRHWAPRQVIEVGSGYSTLLMADVNRRYLGGKARIVSIEPYPPAFLSPLPEGVAELIALPVQEVPMERFEALEAGDVLFIDSSHVCKTGSDVNHLVFEVLPRLAAGVHVHFHDIFLPQDYPREWVLNLGLYWNEQYLLRALLMHSRAFRVTFGSTYASTGCRDAVIAALSLMPGSIYGGGSFWIEKVA